MPKEEENEYYLPPVSKDQAGKEEIENWKYKTQERVSFKGERIIRGLIIPVTGQQTYGMQIPGGTDLEIENTFDLINTKLIEKGVVNDGQLSQNGKFLELNYDMAEEQQKEGLALQRESNPYQSR